MNNINVIWEDYVIPKPKEISNHDIGHFELLIKFSFPDDYKSLIIREQGKNPVKYMFSSEKLTRVPFGPLYHLNIESDSKNSSYGVYSNWDKWKEYYGANVIPIADAGGACFFAYVDSDDLSSPSIFFVDVEEEELLFVAKSITELIKNLV